MSKKKIYLAVQAVLWTLTAAALSLAVAGLYREGAERAKSDVMAWYFTRELSAERFRTVAPLVFAALISTAAGIILRVRDERQDIPVQDAEYARDLVTARVAVPDEAMKSERSLQKILTIAGRAGFALCMAPLLWYLSRGEHFPQGDKELEWMIRSLASVFLPCALLGVTCLAVSFRLRERSMLRETEAAKARLKEEAASGVRREKASPDAGNAAGALPAPGETAYGKQRKIRLALLCLSAALIAAGVWNGSARDVLMKAVKICTECIGLG